MDGRKLALEIEHALDRRGLSAEYCKEIRRVLDQKPVAERIRPDLVDVLEAAAGVMEDKASQEMLMNLWLEDVGRTRGSK